ncbi:Scr1 family TA system antitoxin-like transcriptional regulator [Nocardia sp. NPDC004068]|uniref:helix-turn-helix domain-containing protein n=1 Tax=Nocardia sp. NPDC004068 TaxID=3364303 RepID=UPI0036A3403C
MVAEGSTLARRALGRQLEALRKRAGISQFQAARVLGISPQTMGRLEDGLSAPSARDLYMNALCDHYGVSDGMRRTILALAHDVRAAVRHGGGWWRPHMDRRNDAFDPYSAVEDAVKRLTAWSVVLLPKIAQTPDYCRAVAWTAHPNAPTEQIEASVERSLKQRERLNDSNFDAEIFLSEAAVREEWGGPSVMAEQRRHLAELTQRPNVSIRLVPFNTRNHIGALVGPFSLLEFPLLPHSKFVEPPLVYIEEYVGNLYLERSEEVGRYKAALTELRRVALSESDSAARILAVSDE